MSGEPTPTPKAPRWWLRILLGLMAFFLLMFVGIAVAAYRWGNRPENREKLGAVSDLIKMGVELANAPGTAELRALGCSKALVMDGERLSQMSHRLERLSGTKDGAEEPEAPEVVSLFCGVARGKAVRCDQVVGAYVKAVPTAPELLFVVVQEERGHGDPLCQGLYERSGALVEAVAEDAE